MSFETNIFERSAKRSAKVSVYQSTDDDYLVALSLMVLNNYKGA